MQQKDKLRVYELARELDISSKDLLDLCKKAGLDVKNQLSSLDHDQREAVEILLKRKPGSMASVATPAAAVTTAASTSHGGGTATLAPPPPRAVPTAAAQAPPQPASPPVGAPSSFSSRVPDIMTKMRNLNALNRPPALQPRPVAPPSGGGGPATPTSPPPSGAEANRTPRDRIPRPRPVSTPILATPPKPRVQVPLKPEEKKAEEPAAQKPMMRLSPEMLKAGPTTAQEVLREMAKQAAGDVAAPATFEEEDEESKKKRPGAVKGRDERHAKRAIRAKDRTQSDGDKPQNLLRTLSDEGEDERRRRLKRIRHAAPKHPGTLQRKGKVVVEMPITVRSLCEALGVKAGDILRKCMEHGQMLNINAEISPDAAQVVALDFGMEIDVKKPLDPEEQLLAKLEGEDKPEDLVLRAPIVTIMGHVDHGKTSLLDRIRESNVVATEAGGITQHLRAWRVEHNGRPITFLDTPGHEAFTQMRARGANVTDIVVLVVAADDGVMPQTEEAISHAKAASVPIVVAINKIDLPNANLNRTRQQLYAKELIPDTMGGDVPFVETVATPGKVKGVSELLDMLSLVAEMKELKANPNKPGQGTCLEAKLSEGQGVVATLLVRDGTLRRGDVVVCGPTFGRVRAMFDDVGQSIEEAGPSIPVRITGLDEVPNADDKFQAVPDVNVAREIAEQRGERVRTALPSKLATFRLEDLDKAKVAELKVILKADVRGSIEAIKKEMEKLQHDEVRIHLLHSGIGAITEGDVQLALASPADSLIVGFNVVPDDRARTLADDKGIQIRHYDIIYQLTDDLKSALEGKLKPKEEIIHLGRAVVRRTFKISKVGTVAGCAVTQGTIERNARIRLIRDGVVIYPPPERTAGLDSLKRVKDDVREVREGYECGIKIAGYDDVKEGDVIEAFRIEQVQRTL